METELIRVGHRYYTKANDLIEIAEKIHVDLPDGFTHHYNARVLRAVDGHKALIGRVMRYDERGRWLNSDGIIVERCIHDLREEACDDHGH